ncbi:deoxyribodipyrimidine photo-lyase [Salinibacterium sp. M195]|uniref:cryptochrome/photolyase family protein n=1 Tax=Salinibacterium sp. M195 TaxID=2583374 RepID=UPI001C630BC7|nr:deoxyribodipyrimidine photo-lyase [Salinibacterium sp. M195]QYH34636.1 deoxyribodipyrimidine photo-lyase [Salinibacterium sp. M195]
MSGNQNQPSIVWLRNDLRLADNPALTAAASEGRPLVVAYIHDETGDGIRPLGAASKWWLHHSLIALDAALQNLGGQLTLRHGPAAQVLPALVDELGAASVHWNRRYTAARDIDAGLKTRLREQGLAVESHQGNLLNEPWQIRNGQGEPYKVFTPYWRAAQDRPVRDALPAPTAAELSWAADSPACDDLADWNLLPTRPDWAEGLREAWTPGEDGAHDRLESFVAERLADYHRRDEPAVEATSGLSPHLRFGEISPTQVWNRLRGNGSGSGTGPDADSGSADVPTAARKNIAKFLSEIGWREFSTALLFDNPRLATDSYRPAYNAFPWGYTVDEIGAVDKPAGIDEVEAWRRGRTGIPLVDAGMRELWHTGTMHNRVRMVVASFLIKNLLIDWRAGEQWFWETLVDADEASNPANWQWVAGSGADAAPYFRVFNPVLQQKKFDPTGEYVARWIPELGTDAYPAPIVDLAETRREALEAYTAVKAAAASN